MLRGYEDITYELTEDEMLLVAPIVKGLSKRIGKEKIPGEFTLVATRI